MVEGIKETLDFIEKNRFNEIPQRKALKMGEYTFSILTGSHWESATLGTVEMAILKNGFFVFDSGVFENGDSSIIHYMEFEDFKNFCKELSRKNVDYEKLFLKYKKKAEQDQEELSM